MLEKEERQKRVTISMHPILIGTLEPEDVFLSLFCTWKHAVGAPNDTITQHNRTSFWPRKKKLWTSALLVKQLVYLQPG